MSQKTEKWTEIISDHIERKVFEALSDETWDFRTVEGITETTQLPDSEVKTILTKYPNLVRKSSIPDAKGRDLFLLRDRGSSREFWRRLRTWISKEVR